jgi:two-component system OmpR family sensor kinase
VKSRLYLHLYLALLASAFVCLGVAAIAFRLLRDSGGPPRERMRRAALALSEQVPDARAPDAALHLTEIADQFGVDVVLGDGSGPLAGAPSAHAFPVPRQPAPGWRRDRMGPTLVTPLDAAGGWAVLRPRGAYLRLRLHPFFTTLVVLALVMAIGSYPIARRVTRRLETLAHTVEAWGRGDLTSRVPVSGNDEVATLALTFNHAAERLELLLTQQRQMLANASHELRSPLARLRMGLELMAEEPDSGQRQTLVQEIHRDIVELDGLIEDVLLMARSDTRVPRRALVSVDLTALVREEAARSGAEVEVGWPGPGSGPGPGVGPGPGPGVGSGPAPATPVRVPGDLVLLRHLIRNLLENAHQHGAGAPVRVHLTAEEREVRLAVEDQGPGVAEEDRERIFAPFFRLASAPASGHGVGLALVRQVARYHGGDVVYRPRQGGGSRFEVTLPAA